MDFSLNAIPPDSQDADLDLSLHANETPSGVSSLNADLEAEATATGDADLNLYLKAISTPSGMAILRAALLAGTCCCNSTTGGAGGGPVSWQDIQGKPTCVESCSSIISTIQANQYIKSVANTSTVQLLVSAAGQLTAVATIPVARSHHFKVGAPGKPQDGATTYVPTEDGVPILIGKPIKVYREGERQTEGDLTNGYTFDDTQGRITFYPDLADKEDIEIVYGSEVVPAGGGAPAQTGGATVQIDLGTIDNPIQGLYIDFGTL